jgi:hypothetical protein
MNRYELLDKFGKLLLDEMGEAPNGSYNPIIEALRNPHDFYARYGGLKGFSKTSVARAAVVCQMAVYDADGGPEGDGRPKALRRHWYTYFKVDVAQPLSVAYGENLQDSRWGLNWAGRLSQIYAKLVDSFAVDYKGCGLTTLAECST